MSNVSTVCFSISGDFITNHSRDLWAERKFSKAIALLKTLIGFTHEHVESVLFGKSKLEGINNLDLVEDNWTPPDEYPTYEQALQQGEHYEELERKRYDMALMWARDNWWETRGNKTARLRYYSYLESQVGTEKAEQITEIVMHEKAGDGNEEGGYYASCQLGLNSQDRDRGVIAFEPKDRVPLSEMVAHQLRQRMELAGMDPTAMASANAILNRGMDKTPTLCPDMSSRSGWLLPTGKYYGCGPMEHIGVATQLLEKKYSNRGDMEKVAEELGWVKLAYGVTGFHVHCDRKPTQKQLTKLWDYAQFHEQDYQGLLARLPQ